MLGAFATLGLDIFVEVFFAVIVGNLLPRANVFDRLNPDVVLRGITLGIWAA